jgi:hypothetical protein
MKNKGEKMYSVLKETLKGKPSFIPYQSKLNINTNIDYYLSLFQYSEQHKKEAETKGTIAGLKNTTTTVLYFDFDSKTNVELAKSDAIDLAKTLVERFNIDPENIKCYFSGFKGFGIELSLDKRITNDQFKAAVQRLAGHYKTFDHVVSDANRVLRVPNTKHPVSGLYKIPLKLYELDELSTEEIKTLASAPRKDDFINNPIKLPNNLFVVEAKKESNPVEVVDDLKAALENKPRHWRDYKWALAQGFFESGERHNALMVVAATCRGLGYDKQTAYYICKAALKKQAARTGSDEFDKGELFENIIERSVYSDTWEGGQYSPKTNPWLAKYCERMGFLTDQKEEEVRPKRILEVKDSFEHYVKHIEENTVLTGISILDREVPLTVGMNLGIVGAASSGKTALALEILKNTSKSGVVSVFASLDMHRNRLFEKLLYKTTGLTREQLYTKIKQDGIDSVTEKLKEDYANVFFYDRSCPTVADIRDFIEKVQEETGKPVKLVMVDYFERVNSERSDETAASKDVAGQLQDLINDLNVCLITLVQPNKFSLSGGPDAPIKSYTAIKGSSFLYQSFRSIISIWRPFFTPEDKERDNYMQMGVLKNDLGELGIYNFSWNGKKGEIKEMTEEQEEYFQSLLKEKEAKKSAKASDGWE